ncbi:glutathione S-transferase T3-like [Andrographis paniculata]|uniref:glutathione S-transferase T3-like n=1 Tax=Andrographis paniculata TaxID=175694 RepID=UPI0021E7FD7D|nr:glutathione S-transferase T3-like [Andrographis paniculata]
MLGNQPMFPTSNVPFQPFNPPPYYQIPPNFYPPNFQAFGSSSSPQFMMQATEAMDTPQYYTPINLADDNVPDNTKNKDTRKVWSSTEDKLLISAWLNTSKDAVTNTDQPSSAFWKRIASYYMENKPESATSRGVTQCKNHWSKICKAVQKFVGCYEEANRNIGSGHASKDVLNAAKKIYLNDGEKKDFVHENAWRILRDEPKWKASYCESSRNSGGSSKRTKTSEDGGYSTVKEQSLKQQSEKIEALLKAKRLEKTTRKIDRDAKRLQLASNKMEMLMMLMAKSDDNLTDFEKGVKERLARECFL